MTKKFQMKTDGSWMYDPPNGWRYGFPRPYKPLPGESLEETLLRDGYPKTMLDVAAYTRFWVAKF